MITADRGQQRIERLAIAEFQAARIETLRLVKIARQWQLGMAGVIGGRDDIRRPSQQCRDRHRRISRDRNERVLAPFSSSRRTR